MSLATRTTTSLQCSSSILLRSFGSSRRIPSLVRPANNIKPCCQSISLLRRLSTKDNGDTSSVSSEATATPTSVIKSDATTVDDAAAASAARSSFAPLTAPSRPLFPWRSESMNNLIPRLTPGTNEFNTLIPIPSSNEFLTWFFLQYSLWNSLISQEWKTDLENGTMYAFTKAVAGICANVYRIPLDQIYDEKGTSSSSKPTVKFTFEPPHSQQQDEEDDSSSSNDDATTSDQSTTASSSTNPPDYCENVRDMMTRDLRQLYESAHASGVHQLQIQLQLTPVRAYFHRFYAMPFLSKRHVLDDPTLLTKTFLQQESDTQFVVSWNNMYNLSISLMNQQLMERQAASERAQLETSIAAEVLVVCEERFCVTDITTGQVLQGSSTPEPREVAHLVTMEQTVVTTDDMSRSGLLPRIQSTPSNWQIADIDDLLGADKWFHVVVPIDDDDDGDDNDDQTAKMT